MDIELSHVIQLLQFTGYIGVGIVFVVLIKSDVKVLKVQMESITQNMNLLNTSFSRLGEVLTNVAVQDSRIANIEDDLRELKHGHGFIVNGEYDHRGKVSKP